MPRRRQAFESELAAVPLLGGLSDGQRADLARRARRAREPRGMTFSKEGERGDELVVILEGEVEVRRNGAILAVLGAGDFVGEVALLDETAQRTATVVASTPVVVAYVSRHDFEYLTSEAPGLLESIRATMRRRSVNLDESDDATPG